MDVAAQGPGSVENPEASPPPERLDTRELNRLVRRPPESGAMPEAVAWRAYLELRRRGEAQANEAFLNSLRGLQRRRVLGTAALSLQDPDPEDHLRVEDPFLGELWKAYKRCLLQGRPGTAGALLRDIEARIGV